VEYGLANRAAALSHAARYSRGLTDERTDTFVGMYVNRWTVDYGREGREAVRRLLDRGFEAGIIPHRTAVEFVG
jgi:1,4-dihydroxy-6-naphthoate synthase